MVDRRWRFDDALGEESGCHRAKCWAADFFLRCNERCCSVKNLQRRLPVLTWLPKYSLGDLEGDLVAGLTVALTVIPQGLALAVLANLPPQYGLYTAFMGCFMYVLFGSCKDLTIGPTAIMSLMTAEHVHKGGPVYAILLSFLSGIIQLAMGFLNLGFLVNFISGPVISGFTSAAAITIAITQLKGIFGLRFNSETTIEFIREFFRNIQNTNLYDMAMGLTSVFLLLAIRQFKDRKFPDNSRIPAGVRFVLEKMWFMFATGRNAILVLICAGIAAGLLSEGKSPLTLTKDVRGALPPFELPAFSIDEFDEAKNTTVHYNFIDIVQELGSGVIVIPLLSILEAIAIGKAFAKGKKLDATQELIALGVCNFMGSFVGAYPATGSFSRTAINNNSGVRTPLSGLFTGTLVLLALSLLAPYFQYIPNASLSAIIFCAVIFMVHYQDVPLIWRTKKIDLLPLAATFIASFVLSLEYGILLGVSISLILLLYHQARPTVLLQNRKTIEGVPYLWVRPDRSILFPSVEYVKEKISKAIPDSFASFTLVFDGTSITGVDYTMALGMKTMIDSYIKENITTIFINLQPGILSSLEGSGPAEFHYCSSEDQMVALIREKTSVSPELNIKHSTIQVSETKVEVPSDGADVSVVESSGAAATRNGPIGPLLASRGTSNEDNENKF